MSWGGGGVQRCTMLPPSSLRTRLVDEARALLPENAFESSFCVRARKKSGTYLPNAHCNSDKSPSTTLSQLWKVLEEVRARYGKLRVQMVHIQIQIRYNDDYVSCSQDSKNTLLFIATQSQVHGKADPQANIFLRIGLAVKLWVAKSKKSALCILWKALQSGWALYRWEDYSYCVSCSQRSSWQASYARSALEQKGWRRKSFVHAAPKQCLKYG